jgi:hypothetical protein
VALVQVAELPDRGPGEVQFSPDGRLLLVTQKTTNVALSPRNAIDVFRVQRGGLTNALPKRAASVGLRPFSVDFRKDGSWSLPSRSTLRPADPPCRRIGYRPPARWL